MFVRGLPFIMHQSKGGPNRQGVDGLYDKSWVIDQRRLQDVRDEKIMKG
jgi:hypothetical protein